MWLSHLKTWTSSQLLLLTRPTTSSTHRLHLHLLPLIPSHLHLPTPQRPKCHNALTRHANHTSARNKPQIHTDASQRRSGKAKQPLDIIRHPALGQPEECFFRKVCLQEEAEARGAEPAEGGCGAVEVAAEGLEGLGWEGLSGIETRQKSILKSLHVPFFSYSSFFLSCCRRSFAHLAKSSWALVLFISRFSLTTSRRSWLPLAACCDCGVGSLV